jgi:hypothetical protein
MIVHYVTHSELVALRNNYRAELAGYEAALAQLATDEFGDIIDQTIESSLEELIMLLRDAIHDANKDLRALEP